jgi:hypothetical protein
VPSEYSCGLVLPLEQEPRHRMVFHNEFVRAFAVEIAPRDRTQCHRHDNEYLTYVACIADIVDARQNEEPETHLLHDGECFLSPAGVVHVVENLSDTSFRNIVVELLPRCNELRRGRPPMRKLADGRPLIDALVGQGAQLKPELANEVAQIRPSFEAERISVHSIAVNRTILAEVLGPALIASPYGTGAEVQQAQQKRTKLNGFRQIEWLPPGATALLRGDDKSSGRAVVFQVGRSEEAPFPVKRSSEEPLKSRTAHAQAPD